MDPVRYRRPMRFVVVASSVAFYILAPAPYYYAGVLLLTASVCIVFVSAMDTEWQ
jgi:hypothetical protein